MPKELSLNTHELKWNLAFDYADVRFRLVQLFDQYGYGYTQTEGSESVDFVVESLGGRILVGVRAQLPRSSAFSAKILIPRTIMQVFFTDNDETVRATFKRQLTMAFLRVGG